MIELRELTCKNCGGKIDRSTLKCPYCDTQYERTHDGVSIKFVPERPGVHTLRAMVRVDEADISRHPDLMERYIRDRLRKGLADALLDYATISQQEEYDPRSFCRVIRAEVKVCDPV